MEKTVAAYISLGGNQGDVRNRFSRALECISGWDHVTVNAVSRIYRTEPQGDPEQPWFVNQVAELGCGPAVTPEALLQALLRLETALGRVRDPGRRFGPRAIDLDLLLFGDIVCTHEGLCLPHPRMARRAFVLVPLCELAPRLHMPGGKPLAAYLENLPYVVSGDTIYQKE